MNFFYLILLMVCLTGKVNVAQAQYTSDASLIQKKKASAILRSSGMHEKKKEAIQMAVQSAFDTYFFTGIDGLNEGKPLLSNDARDKSADYLKRFYDDKNKKYMSFVANVTEENQVKVGKVSRATVAVEIYTESLHRDLLNNKVMSQAPIGPDGPKVEVVEQQVSLPTIMVVPYKQNGISREDILKNIIDYRIPINLVQDKLITKGYEIKDFETVLEATEKSIQMESNSAETSFEQALINSSGADVYVTVDAGYNTNSEGVRGSIAMVAKDKSTGQVLSSKQFQTQRYSKGLYADVYRIAINTISDDFLKDMTNNYAKRAVKGNTFVLRISAGQGSSVDLETNVPSLGIPLSDAMRMWIRKNAVGGRFHVQGSVRTQIIFDGVQVISKSDEGHFLDANDFALDLYQYLKRDLGFNCDKKVDGNTVYINLLD